MTLSDPRQALAERSSLIDYLMGVAALAQLVDVMALDATRESAPSADDFVHLLLGVASLGKSIEQLVPRTAVVPASLPAEPGRWLR
ncbi:MAG: hypothetical protein QOJ95_4866 [Mycobacterium sp.]|jgi:hypothetical protein|nr:hypothetical protein [Mycobacterium sp.]